MISKTLKEIASNYIEAKAGPMTSSKLAELIRNAAKNVLKPAVKKNGDYFKYRSSSGQHANWADVPWLAILDPAITTTTQKGYYIAYLFSIDMKRVYLNLNQGMTELERELKTDGAAKELVRRAEFIRDRLSIYKEHFSNKPIDLSVKLAGNTTRPLLYEKGHTFGKEYDLSKPLNEDELVKDLNNILDLYLELTYRGGLEAEEFTDEYKPEDVELDLTEQRQYKAHFRIERSSTNARKVKKALGYTCQICEFNFKKKYGEISLSKKKEEFIEAHHKVQLSSLPKGEVIKFSIEDFAVLCSNCHKMVHKKNPPYTIEEMKKIIKGSFN